jgi:hypothetical protein
MYITRLCVLHSQVAFFFLLYLKSLIREDRKSVRLYYLHMRPPQVLLIARCCKYSFKQSAIFPVIESCRSLKAVGIWQYGKLNMVLVLLLPFLRVLVYHSSVPLLVYYMLNSSFWSFGCDMKNQKLHHVHLNEAQLYAPAR